MTYLRTCTVACECGMSVSITVETQLTFSSEASASAAIDTELYLLGWTPDGPADDKCPACTEAGA